VEGPPDLRAVRHPAQCGASHGLDADGQGNGVVTTQRLYQLVRQPAIGQDRLFQIEFLDPGVQAFTFTFG
jgi:hypothetical protein